MYCHVSSLHTDTQSKASEIGTLSSWQNFFFVYFIQRAKEQLYLGFRWWSFAYLCVMGM